MAQQAAERAGLPPAGGALHLAAGGHGVVRVEGRVAHQQDVQDHTCTQDTKYYY